jgi:hypothetical protein
VNVDVVVVVTFGDEPCVAVMEDIGADGELTRVDAAAAVSNGGEGR